MRKQLSAYFYWTRRSSGFLFFLLLGRSQERVQDLVTSVPERNPILGVKPAKEDSPKMSCVVHPETTEKQGQRVKGHESLYCSGYGEGVGEEEEGDLMLGVFVRVQGNE